MKLTTNQAKQTANTNKTNKTNEQTKKKKQQEQRTKNLFILRGAILGTTLAHFLVSCPGCMAASLIRFLNKTSEMLQLWFVPCRPLIYFLPL